MIALSIVRDEVYYLNDARYRRALGVKALERREELEKIKAELPEKFYSGCLYRIEEIS